MERNKTQSPLLIKNSRLSATFHALSGESLEKSKSKPRTTPRQDLPSLGPLKITLASNNVPPVEPGVSVEKSEEASHDAIQKSWSAYNTLNDSQRNQLIKGILARSSKQQIEFICTCLNLKSLEHDSFKKTLPPKVFPSTMTSKYLISSRRKPTGVKLQEMNLVEARKTTSQESYQEAMKRAFENDVSSDTEYTAASEFGNFMNGNTYLKLMNNDMKPEVLTKQVAKAGPEGVKFLVNFLAKQCGRLQEALKSIVVIAKAIDLRSATIQLFETLIELSGARHGTIYFNNRNQLGISHSSWRRKRELTEDAIFAGNIVLKGDSVNITNFRTSEYYKSGSFEEYSEIDPTCVLSAPFYGDGMRVIGMIELIGKRENNPVFSVEEEFLLQAFASLTTIIYSQVVIKEAAEKKSDGIKSFLTAANAIPSQTDPSGGLTSMILSTARELVSADRCALFLLDKAKGELWSKVAEGTGEIRFPANKGIAGYVATTGEVCSIVDAYEDSRFNREFDIRNNYRTKSILCVPMKDNDGEIIGVVQAVNKKPEGYIFNSDDITQLCSFATLSASTLQKSEETSMMQTIIDNLKVGSKYMEVLVRSLECVIITFDEEGKVHMVENAGLVGLNDMVDTMYLTSYEHWLGRQNSDLADDIKTVFLKRTPIKVQNYQFRMGDQTYLVNYTIKDFNNKKQALTPLIKKESGGGSRKPSLQTKISSRKNTALLEFAQNTEPAVKVQGFVLTMEVVTPNRLLFEQLGSQLSKHYLENFSRDPKKLEGETVQASVLIVDIKRASGLMKHLAASKVVLLMNLFYDLVATISAKYNGIIVDTSADSAVVVFGTAAMTDDLEIIATNAALDIQKHLPELNKQCESQALPPIQLSIGLSTGPIIAGAIGMPKLRQYKILGAPISEAKDYELAGKKYGAKIVTGAETKDALKDSYHIRELDMILLKGEQQPMAIYEIMASSHDAHNHDMMSTILSYELGLTEYRAKNWQAAAMHFKKAHTLIDDQPSKQMFERCRAIIDGRYELSEDWDGCWDL